MARHSRTYEVRVRVWRLPEVLHALGPHFFTDLQRKGQFQARPGIPYLCLSRIPGLAIQLLYVLSCRTTILYGVQGTLYCTTHTVRGMSTFRVFDEPQVWVGQKRRFCFLPPHACLTCSTNREECYQLASLSFQVLIDPFPVDSARCIASFCHFAILRGM